MTDTMRTLAIVHPESGLVLATFETNGTPRLTEHWLIAVPPGVVANYRLDRDAGVYRHDTLPEIAAGEIEILNLPKAENTETE